MKALSYKPDGSLRLGANIMEGGGGGGGLITVLYGMYIKCSSHCTLDRRLGSTTTMVDKDFIALVQT